MDIQIFAAIYFRGNFCLGNIAKINRSRNCIGLQYFSCSIWGSIQYLKDEHLCTQSSYHWWNDKNVFLTFSELEKNGPLIWHGSAIWRWRVRPIDVFGENVKLYDCNHCGYRSRWSASVRRHTKLKHQTRNFVPNKELTPFICDYCVKQYKHRYSLSVHSKLKHTKRFRFVCSRCDKGFIQLWTYRGHLASHHPELMSKWEVCGKSFAYKSSR